MNALTIIIGFFAVIGFVTTVVGIWMCCIIFRDEKRTTEYKKGH
jgi:hypothetical protein